MSQRPDVVGAIVRRHTVRRRRSTIVTTDGLVEASGADCSRKSRPQLPCRKNFASTARTSKPTAPRQAEKGDPPKRLIADKAYDAEHFRNWLAERRIKAVIPSTASRRTPYPIDCNAYRRRNVIERLFCKLKNWRRIATRYDRLAQNYIAALALAAVVVAWIK